MKIVFLGTGASISGGTRLNTSLLIDLDHWKMLVDCSGFPEHALARQGINITEIGELVITHAHVDHMYAVPSLIHAVRISRKPGGGGKITIHGREDVIQTVQSLIEAFRLHEKKDPVDITYKKLNRETGKLETRNRNIAVEYFPADHGNAAAIGLSIRHRDRHLLFSGDSAVCENIRNRITPDTILIHDCGALLEPEGSHAGAGELAEMLAQSPCRKLYLTHLPFATAGDLARVRGIIKKSFAGEVMIPEDGESISF